MDAFGIHFQQGRFDRSQGRGINPFGVADHTAWVGLGNGENFYSAFAAQAVGQYVLDGTCLIVAIQDSLGRVGVGAGENVTL